MLELQGVEESQGRPAYDGCAVLLCLVTQAMVNTLVQRILQVLRVISYFCSPQRALWQPAFVWRRGDVVPCQHQADHSYHRNTLALGCTDFQLFCSVRRFPQARAMGLQLLHPNHPTELRFTVEMTTQESW